MYDISVYLAYYTNEIRRDLTPMKVLVINAGSSSLKYQLIDMTDESVLAKGNCERIGTDGAFIGFKTPDGQKIERKAEMKNHTESRLIIQ